MFFPSLPFTCELAIERWRIEVVEAQVEDSVSWFADVLIEVVTYVISDLLNRISFHIQLYAFK